MGAAFLCASLGIVPTVLEILREDKSCYHPCRAGGREGRSVRVPPRPPTMQKALLLPFSLRTLKSGIGSSRSASHWGLHIHITADGSNLAAP